jgi:hypothetical protein
MATAQTVSEATASKTAIPEFIKDSPKKLLIGGKWVPAKSARTFETINPATEAVLCHVAEGDKARGQVVRSEPARARPDAT